MNLQRELDIALHAIKEAGKIVLNCYKEDLKINEKQDHTFVTNADIASDNKIREILNKNFPTYGILSEESKDDLSRLKKDYVWIVDPIDGTNDFIHKTDEFSINIALSFKNEIVLGLIFVPAKRILAYAIKNQGSFVIINDKEPLRLKTNDKEKGLTLLVSRFFFDFNKKDLYLKDDFISEVLICGSSYKAIKISLGEADICVKNTPTTKEWDTAPMDIIIKEAGGCFTDYYGNPMVYNGEDTINRNGWIMANNMKSLKKYIEIFKNLN